MKIKIRIRTPKGQARKAEKRLRPWLLGLKSRHATYVNEEDNELYWEVEDNVRKCLKIQRNVNLYEQVVKTVLDNKAVKKTLRGKLSDEQEADLKDMLMNQTKVDVLKEASAKEIVDFDKTFWERVKERFNKVAT